VCVLASGDPGFFGVVRLLAGRFGRSALCVHPAPSSVAVAFARLGMPWDDAAVVSAHGRPLAEAAAAAASAPKAAVLTGPQAPPEALGVALLGLGATHERAAVCTHLGSGEEAVVATDLAGLASGRWDPLAVVVLWSGTGVADHPSLAWGRPSQVYAHRDGMITKPEVRSVVLGLLALPAPRGEPVLWDIGAGSGSVAIECAALAPWLDVVAVDRDPVAAATITANARAHGVAVRVVAGDAPACLDALPDPDRVFVGGGGPDVVAAAQRRLRPGGLVVATHAALDRAATAATLLGHLSAVTANRGERLPDGGWRLEGANPVFVTWGGRPA
jgi:precorrin-6Y C5,15-methyltransferase (decarboxylating)